MSNLVLLYNIPYKATGGIFYGKQRCSEEYHKCQPYCCSDCSKYPFGRFPRNDYPDEIGNIQYQSDVSYDSVSW